MADIISPVVDSPIVSSASSSSKAVSAAAVEDAHDDELDDACSICLEPFNTVDPPTVTNCRHEYHLQCILEWSQRSKECPICWQILVLKDPASQELLAAVERDRNLRWRHDAHHVHNDSDINHDTTSNEDDSEFEVRIMRHFAAAARRACQISRRARERSSVTGPSQILLSVPRGDLPQSDQSYLSPEHRISSYESSEGETLTFGSPNTAQDQYSSSLGPEGLNMAPHSGNRDSSTKPSQHLPNSPQRPSSSEFSAFSDSFKSKFSAASARYKESISKGTRGFKEKLLAHNISVKELGKGVQREMNAGIAGVARIIERLDLASKRNGASAHLSSCTSGTSSLSSERNDDAQWSITDEKGSASENAHVTSSDTSSHLQSTISSRLEAPPVEGGN